MNAAADRRACFDAAAATRRRLNVRGRLACKGKRPHQAISLYLFCKSEISLVRIGVRILGQQDINFI